MTIEAGLLGLLALLALIGCCLVSALAARRTLQREGREEHAQYAQALLASVAAGGCGLAFFDAFAFPQTAGCLFLFIGLAGAMLRITQDPAREG